jgi:hypothetical protein
MIGTTAINVVRAGTTVLSGLTATIDPIDPRPFELAQMPQDAAGETIFDKYTIFPLHTQTPDIRVRDVVLDTGDIDPLTGSAARYYVRRVKRYAGHHLEIEADRVATVPTT